MPRRLAAIMFTDLVGFTSSAQADEPAALARLHEQEEIVRPLFASYEGREVKSTGDGFLVEFESALKATECAIDIQTRLRDRNAKTRAPPIQVRIGIHVGDVEAVGADIFGNAVNVASRVVPLAEPGGICLTGETAAHVRERIPYALERLAPKTVKGVREPLDFYRIVLPGIERAPPPERSPLPRVAVLPLANISPDPKDEYFADGLTEELISVLSQIRGLRVIARTSVGQYKGTSKPIGQIGSELGVDAILEGSVRKAGDQLRIAVQLIDVKTEEHRWAQTYDRMLANVFAIQAEVAERTAGALKLELLSSERDAVLERPTSSLVAYEAYLRGIQASRRFTAGVESREELGRAVARHFEEALREDPDFAAAHSHLANFLVEISGITEETQRATSRAREHVHRALELNPRSSDAHAALGNLLMQADLDWPRAESEFRQALELNPSSSTAHFWYSGLLAILQRYTEAKDHLNAAIELDPHWLVARQARVSVRTLSGDWDVAVREAEELVESFSSDPRLERELVRMLAFVYGYVGRTQDAIRADARVSYPSDPGSQLAHAVFLAWLGKKRGLEARLRTWEESPRSEYFTPMPAGHAYAVLGRTDAAVARLEEDIRNGEAYLWVQYQSPFYDSIRDDPRFVELLERAHLPTSQSWRRAASSAGREKSRD